MLLRDRLLARMAQMGGAPDYVRLAEEVLAIRNAPPALARRLVEQALVVEDRRDEWLRMGERVCAEAPSGPGVYVLRGADGRALYVGKANNIRRRLRTHFAARRWRAIKPELAQAVSVEWREVGSELEALVCEAEWIRDLAPAVNVQVGVPNASRRAVPGALRQDTLVVVPSASPDRATLVAARAAGPVFMIAARRDGVGLREVVSRVWAFFRDAAGDAGSSRLARAAGSRSAAEDYPLAPIVFSWLAGRGAASTRLDPHDASSARELQRRLGVAFGDERLFSERIVVIRSRFRPAPKRP